MGRGHVRCALLVHGTRAACAAGSARQRGRARARRLREGAGMAVTQFAEGARAQALAGGALCQQLGGRRS